MVSYERDIAKLKHYAKKLGIKLVFKRVKYKPDAGKAEAWYSSVPSPVITVLVEPKVSGTTIILRLLHELGHHLDYLSMSNEQYKAEDTAIILENKGAELVKEHREVIRSSEHRATSYMERIADDLSLSVPRYKVTAEAEADRWAADQFAITGSMPSDVEFKRFVVAARRRLRDKK